MLEICSPGARGRDRVTERKVRSIAGQYSKGRVASIIGIIDVISTGL